MTESNLTADVGAGHFRFWLAGIVMGSMVLATTWALRMPIFQEPDELAHIDYAFALYNAGRPFRVHDAIAATEVTPQVRYLSSVSGYRRMRYNPSARVPAGYGTGSFIATVDKAAPAPPHRLPASGDALPYVMFGYPIAYYTIVAMTMSFAGALSHGSLVTQVIAARLLNVIFFGITLVLTAAVLRGLRVSAATTLLATVAIGAFPLTGWVSGYVQPDNLSFLLLTATLYVALRWRNSQYSQREATLLGLALSALFMTKQQYGLVGWSASAALVLAYCYARVSLPVVAANVTLALLLPLAVAIVSLLWTPVAAITPGQRLVTFAWPAGPSGTPAALTQIAGQLLSCFMDAYAGGNVFTEYWFRFGFRGETVFPRAVVRFIQYPIVVLTATAVITALFVEVRVLRRLVTIARWRSFALVCRLLSSGIAWNMYVATTLLLFAVHISTQGWLALEGRYWLPVIVPSFIIILISLPRFVAMRIRQSVARVIACTFAIYSVVASLSALAAIGPSYYGVAGVPQRDPYAAVEDIIAGDERIENPHAVVKLPVATWVIVHGFAVDMLTGYPARRVVLQLDGRRRYAAHTGQPSPWIARFLHDDAIQACGFSIELPPGTLQQGKHRLVFSVKSAGGVAIPFEQAVDVELVARER